jgi:hypothetical protein
MISSYILSLVSLATGVWMCHYTSDWADPHVIIGLIVICSCGIQPFTGLIHHLLYKNRGRPNAATYPHVWLGRVLITAGAINAGLGFRLSGPDTAPSSVFIGYGVGAAIVWVVWMGVVVMALVRSRGKRQGENGDTVYVDDTGSEEAKQVSSLDRTPPNMDK